MRGATVTKVSCLHIMFNAVPDYMMTQHPSPPSELLAFSSPSFLCVFPPFLFNNCMLLALAGLNWFCSGWPQISGIRGSGVCSV